MKEENQPLLHHELGIALAHVPTTVSHTRQNVLTEDRGLLWVPHMNFRDRLGFLIM